jgi:deoxyhypusine synthase
MFLQLVFDTIYWIFGYAAGVSIHTDSIFGYAAGVRHESIRSLAMQLVFDTNLFDLWLCSWCSTRIYSILAMQESVQSMGKQIMLCAWDS